jgi:ATP-dependent helicase/nuclease subunit B
MRGLLLADPGVVKLLDSKMERQSDILPVSFTSGGAFYKNSPVVTEEQFIVLKAYLRELYRKTGQKIFSGEVGIQPIKLKARTSCSYCKFKAVCQFDPALPENKYRIMPEADNSLIWREMSGMPEVQPGE